MYAGSGGFEVPSMLSWRVLTILAVIASKLGIFLYPTLVRGLSGKGATVPIFSG